MPPGLEKKLSRLEFLEVSTGERDGEVREVRQREREVRQRERVRERERERREEGHGNKRGVWQSNYVKKVGNKKIQTNQKNHRMSCDVDSLPRSCTDEGIVGDLRNNLA